MRCRTLLKDSATTIRYNYRNVQPLNLRPVAKVDVTHSNFEDKIDEIKDDLGEDIGDLKTFVRSSLDEFRTFIKSYTQRDNRSPLSHTQDHKNHPLSTTWKQLNNKVKLRYYSPDYYTHSTVNVTKEKSNIRVGILSGFR